MSNLITGKTNNVSTTLKDGLVSYWDMEDQLGPNVTDLQGSNNGKLYGSLTNGLVSYWKLDESSGTTASDSHGSNNGTVSGATWTTGKINNALSVTSKSDYITISEISGSIISVSLWYYFDGTGGTWNTLLCRNGGSYHHLLIQTSTNLIGYYNKPSFISSGFALVPENWYHLTIIKDGTNQKLYVNGILRQDDSSSFDNNTYPLSIIANNSSSTPSQGSLGKLDEIGVWNRALTEAEVKKLYREGNPLSYPLQDASYVSAKGKIGNALEFTDVADVVDLGTSLDSIKTSSFSISYWVKPIAVPTGRILSSDRNESTDGLDGDYGTGIDADRKLYFYYRGASTVSLVSNTAIDTNWNYIVHVRDVTAGTRKIYINGVLDAELSSGDTFTGSGTVNSGTSIGDELQPNFESHRGFRGLLDETAIWNRALTQSEINELYNSGIGKTYKNLDKEPKQVANFGKLN
jgi:hypothetical protein